MNKRNLLTLILSVALLGVNLNVNAMRRGQPDNPSRPGRRQEKRPRRERPAAQPVITERSIQKLQILDQQFRVFLRDLEDLNRHGNDDIRNLLTERVDIIRNGAGILAGIINKTSDHTLMDFLRQSNDIFSTIEDALNKAYHVGANPGIINPLLEQAENIKRLIAEIIIIQNSAPIIEDLNEDRARGGQRNAPPQPAPMQQDDSGFDSSDDEADFRAQSQRQQDDFATKDRVNVLLPVELPKTSGNTSWWQSFSGFFSRDKKQAQPELHFAKQSDFVKSFDSSGDLPIHRHQMEEDKVYAFERPDELNLGIDEKKLKILFKRLVSFYKKLEALSKEKNDFLQQEVIAKEHIPFLKKKIHSLVILSKCSSSVDEFYPAFKDLEVQIVKNQISQTLELLHEDDAGNSLLNRTIYLSNKVQDLLKRNYSHSQRIEDEFSDASDSEVEDNKKKPEEVSAESIQSKLQKYKNLQRAKSDERNLAGIDLSGLDLSGLDLSNKDLTGSNFRNSNLSNTKFNSSNLTGTIFESAVFEKTDLSEANITQVNFSNLASWNNVKLDGVKEAQGSNLSGLNLQNIKFADEANFTDAILNDADLTNASLNGANLLRTQLNKAILNGAKLNKAKLNGTKLREAKLHKAELREAVINDSDLIKAEIIDAKVERINIGGNTLLNSSILSDLHFDFATLKDFEWKYATIINTVFFKSTFCNISLNNSSLYNVSFEKTTLKNIDLSDSVIEKLTIKNISLICDTLYFTNSKLKECFFIGKTTENKKKRKSFFIRYTIEEHHKFYSDSDFEKIYSLMKFCDFSLAKLNNVYFTNILFGLWSKSSEELFSARKNLGNISQIESVIFNKIYFYKHVPKEGTLEFNKTKDCHEKFATMLRHKGAVVNEKISGAYQLYLERHQPDRGMTLSDWMAVANTGANVLGNVGSAAGGAMQGYAALKTATATTAALAAAQSSTSGLGAGTALAGGAALGLGGMALAGGGAAAATGAALASAPAIMVAPTLVAGAAAGPMAALGGALASAAPFIAGLAVL